MSRSASAASARRLLRTGVITWLADEKFSVADHVHASSRQSARQSSRLVAPPCPVVARIQQRWPDRADENALGIYAAPAGDSSPNHPRAMRAGRRPGRNCSQRRHVGAPGIGTGALLACHRKPFDHGLRRPIIAGSNDHSVGAKASRRRELATA